MPCSAASTNWKSPSGTRNGAVQEQRRPGPVPGQRHRRRHGQNKARPPPRRPLYHRRARVLIPRRRGSLPALRVQSRQDDPSDHPRGSFHGSFRIPGTNTSVRLYGFARLQASGDPGPWNRSDVVTDQSIPLERGADGARTGGDVQFSARRSRVGIEMRTPLDEDFGNIRTQVEIDFAEQTSDLTTQATNNSYTSRLRQAFAEFGQFQDGGRGKVLVGQSASLFAETSWCRCNG